MQELLYQSAIIAIKAGELVLKYYGLEEFALKSDSSPLTKADLESINFINKYFIFNFSF